jgi:hypothetical protein
MVGYIVGGIRPIRRVTMGDRQRRGLPDEALMGRSHSDEGNERRPRYSSSRAPSIGAVPLTDSPLPADSPLPSASPPTEGSPC